MLHGAHEPGQFGGSLGFRVYLRFRVWGSTDSKGLWDLGIRRGLGGDYGMYGVMGALSRILCLWRSLGSVQF